MLPASLRPSRNVLGRLLSWAPVLDHRHRPHTLGHLSDAAVHGVTAARRRPGEESRLRDLPPQSPGPELARALQSALSTPGWLAGAIARTERQIQRTIEDQLLAGRTVGADLSGASTGRVLAEPFPRRRGAEVRIGSISHELRRLYLPPWELRRYADAYRALAALLGEVSRLARWVQPSPYLERTRHAAAMSAAANLVSWVAELDDTAARGLCLELV